MHIKRVIQNCLLILIGIWLISTLREAANTFRDNSELDVETKRIVTGYSDLANNFIVKHFYKSEGFIGDTIDPRDITLVTHCTTDKLHHLINLVESWTGPISISILAVGDDAAFVDDAIDGLRSCWPLVRRTTTFHVVYVKDQALSANYTGLGSFTYHACKDVMRKMKLRKSKLLSEEISLQYPHNLMRNTALRGAYTEYVLVTNIDLIPSENLRENFLNFALNNKLFSPIKPQFYMSDR